MDTIETQPDLQQEVAGLRSQVDALQRQIMDLQSAAGGDAGRGQSRSRRDLLKLAGTAAAGAVGALALSASPAAATDGSNVVLGDSKDTGNANTAEQATEIAFDGTTEPGVLFLVNETTFAPGAAAYPAALAGWATAKAGVYGFSESGYALVGNGFTGGGAVPLHLDPRGIPTTGAHALGNIAMDTNGMPKICLVAGTPGTFVPLQPGGSGIAFFTAVSTQQYGLSGSDGVAWHDIDAAHLSLSITPLFNSLAILYANADLFTDTATFNQDIAVTVNGAVQAWKESGGFAGTFSPNAAFVHGTANFVAGTPYTVKLQWKTNKPQPTSAHIYAGAGPLPAGSSTFSPTRLSVHLIPV